MIFSEGRRPMRTFSFPSISFGPNTSPFSKGALLFAAVVLVVLLSAVFVSPSARAQSSEVRITNHVFAERIIQTADGGYIAQDVLVGFERGTHTFETLTQIVLPRGNHNIEIALTEPNGAELERIRFGTVQANQDDWTQSLRGTWRNIRFRNSGLHELIVYRAGRAIARFSVVVTR